VRVVLWREGDVTRSSACISHPTRKGTGRCGQPSEATLVEPTNNRAERGLRGAVIYRKLSLGSQSERGEQTIERLLSVSQTCRLQQRSLFAYLTHVLTANARGDPIPTLV
jgi:hypothetical protein